MAYDGILDREDHDKENEERRKNLTEHASQVRKELEEHRQKIRKDYTEFYKKFH